MGRRAFSIRFARIAAGVNLALLAWLALVPLPAQAGCSHLVTSRGDREATLASSFLGDFHTEPTFVAADPLRPFEMPNAPRRCPGTWCAETPSAPATPSGTVSDRAELWAWCVTDRTPTVIAFAHLLDRPAELHALHRSMNILRPPRFPSFA